MAVEERIVALVVVVEIANEVTGGEIVVEVMSTEVNIVGVVVALASRN